MIIHSTPMMNPGEFNFYRQVLPHRRHTKNWKGNWALECPSQNEGECRSTSARLWIVTPWAKGHTRLVVNKLKTQDWKLHSHIMLYVPLFVCKRYVVVTYQHCAHSSNQSKRYVVVMHRSIILTSCRSHGTYTSNSGELIRIGTKQLRNKQIFIYYPYCIL